MMTNAHWYGLFTMYMDQMPAMELDMTATYDILLDGVGEKKARKAGVDVDAYKAAIEEAKAVAAAHNDKIAKVNTAYEKALKDGDENKMAELRAEGAELNKVSLAAFKEVQQQCLTADDCDVYLGHPQILTNIDILQDTVKQLDKKVLWGENGDGALDIVFNLNSYHDWAYYFFGEKVGYDIVTQYDAAYTDRDKLVWGTDALAPVVYVADTSYDLYMADAMGEKPDYKGAKAIYKEAIKTCYANLAYACEQEIAAMQSVADILK